MSLKCLICGAFGEPFEDAPCGNLECGGHLEETSAATTLPTDSGVRKTLPIARGVLDYFPAALAEVAKLSLIGNEKHNPGQELHHARGKSSDHADCIIRHLLERGVVDTDGLLHDVKVAWRALAMLQEALEARGAPLARGARLPNAEPPCHSRPQEQRCDHAGPGGFMGHTCK